NLQARAGSLVTWNGGILGQATVSGVGAQLVMEGTDFRLDGASLAGLEEVGDSLQFDLPDSAILTATLANGTPAILSDRFRSQIADGTLTLVKTADPPTSGPEFFEVPATEAPVALGQNQSLLLTDGG